MRTDGQTGMTKLIVVFRNLANTPKNTFIFFAQVPQREILPLILHCVIVSIILKWVLINTV